MNRKIKFFATVLFLTAVFGGAALAQNDCVVRDDFNRADSTNMGANWTETSGDFSISNNRAVGTNGSQMSFNNSAATADRACVEVYSGGSVLQYGGVLLKYTSTSDNLAVKVQDNDNNGSYERIFFQQNSGFVYNTNCANTAINAPFTSARLTVYLDGSTLKADIDTNFDNVTDQSYQCDGAPTKTGTKVGLQIYGTTQLDNFATPPNTLTVTKIADTNDGVCDADCSLREAVAVALAGDTVQFASPLFDTEQTISINGQITIDKSLTINGRGANLTTIRNVAAAGGTSRVLLVTTGTVNLNGLTMTGGNLTAGVAVNGCSASVSCGGGIHNSGNLTITNSVVSGNTIPSGGVGLGGGIFNIEGTLTVINSTISNNSANGNIVLGGGIHIQNNAATISNSTISSNSVTANTAGQSGGINVNVNATMNISNSTVTNNYVIGVGEGGGVTNSATTNAVNTIISGNFAPIAPDLKNNPLSANSTNNLVGGNVRLLPLGNYGGSAPTHALLPDSPAINAGNNCVLTLTCAVANPTAALTLDQRGRPRTGAVDIGATEAGANLIVTNTNDSGAGSLRDALAFTNSTTADESITFNILANDAGCVDRVCTIALTSGQLTVNSAATAGNLIISNIGGMATDLKVSGNNQSRVMQVDNGANLVLNNFTITNGFTNLSNSAGAGINQDGGSLALLNMFITNNRTNSSNGGGLYCCSSFTGNLTISNSTFTGNYGFNNGGGLFVFGLSSPAVITNSTFSGNTTPLGNGGGILTNTGIIVINSTVTNNSAGNRGGGISAVSGTVFLRNTIIAVNSANGNPEIVQQGNRVFSDGNNLVTNSADTFSPITWQTTGATADILDQNPRLAPLGFYGGGMPTHALLSGSPALNAGNNCVTNLSCSSNNPPSVLTTDQRGANRVGNVDIGAFEVNNSANGGNYRAVLPYGRLSSLYNFTLIPNNGLFTYTLSGGAFPSGIGLATNFAPQAVVSIGGTPSQSGIFNFSLTASDGVNSNVTDYQLRVLVPTAAALSVSGRVLAGKSGVTNATVILTKSDGTILTTRTGTFGFYRFEGVAAGETVIVSVVSKRFSFAPQIVSVRDSIADLDFSSANE